MSKVHQLKSFLRHILTAKTRFYIHSPFVFEFINEIKRNKNQYYAFKEIKKIRLGYLNSTKTIEVEDLGAGSHQSKSSTRKVSDIARYAATSPKKGRILFNLVNHYQPKHIIELGTSLGIGTLYMAKANSNTDVHSIEGASEVAALAESTFKHEQADNIKLYKGSFSNKLKGVLESIESFDLAFIDGHHSHDATLDYFNTFLNYASSESILVFDDIYWSKEMTIAWEKIKEHPKVTVSIDLFHFGICFLHESQAKESFRLYF